MENNKNDNFVQSLQEFGKQGLSGLAIWSLLIVTVICLVVISIFTAKIDKNYELSIKMQAVVETSAVAIQKVVEKIDTVMDNKQTIVTGCKNYVNEAKAGFSHALRVIDEFSQKNNIVIPSEFFRLMQTGFKAIDDCKDVLIGK